MTGLPPDGAAVSTSGLQQQGITDGASSSSNVHTAQHIPQHQEFQQQPHQFQPPQQQQTWQVTTEIPMQQGGAVVTMAVPASPSGGATAATISTSQPSGVAAAELPSTLMESSSNLPGHIQLPQDPLTPPGGSRLVSRGKTAELSASTNTSGPGSQKAVGSRKMAASTRAAAGEKTKKTANASNKRAKTPTRRFLEKHDENGSSPPRPRARGRSPKKVQSLTEKSALQARNGQQQQQQQLPSHLAGDNAATVAAASDDVCGISDEPPPSRDSSRRRLSTRTLAGAMSVTQMIDDNLIGLTVVPTTNRENNRQLALLDLLLAQAGAEMLTHHLFR